MRNKSVHDFRAINVKNKKIAQKTIAEKWREEKHVLEGNKSHTASYVCVGTRFLVTRQVFEIIMSEAVD